MSRRERISPGFVRALLAHRVFQLVDCHCGKQARHNQYDSPVLEAVPSFAPGKIQDIDTCSRNILHIVVNPELCRFVGDDLVTYAIVQHPVPVHHRGFEYAVCHQRGRNYQLLY